MMALTEMGVIKTILIVVVAALAAIVYSLRIVVSMDRKLLRIDSHMELLVEQLMRKFGSAKQKRKR